MTEQDNPEPAVTRAIRRSAGDRRGSWWATAAAFGAAITGRAGGQHSITDDQARLIDKVTASATANASLSDVRHVVILMQENRSFDHYFGTLSDVRGFSTGARLTRPSTTAGSRCSTSSGTNPAWAWTRPGTCSRSTCERPAGGERRRRPTTSPTTGARSTRAGTAAPWTRSCTAHIAADGAANGPVTMGYFTRADLAFYYALADAFTICDGYHCSVLGPTDPNRLSCRSRPRIDPTGSAAARCLTTDARRPAEHYGTFTWKTMPERLLEAGVSWKVYNDPTASAGLSPCPTSRPSPTRRVRARTSS